MTEVHLDICVKLGTEKYKILQQNISMHEASQGIRQRMFKPFFSWSFIFRQKLSPNLPV